MTKEYLESKGFAEGTEVTFNLLGTTGEKITLEKLLEDYVKLVGKAINETWEDLVKQTQIEDDKKKIDIFVVIQNTIRDFLPRQASRALINQISQNIGKYEKEAKRPVPPIPDAQNN